MASIASALIIVNTRDVTPPVTFKIVRKELILSPEARLSSIAEINVWIRRENSTSSSHNGRKCSSSLRELIITADRIQGFVDTKHNKRCT